MATTDAVYATARPAERNALLHLTARSDRKGLGQLACPLCALLATGALVWSARSALWLAPAMFLHGIILVFLFAPLHEAVHWTAFRCRRLNDAVAWACGAVLMLPPAYFRAFHFAHHRHTQDPARDPELAAPKPAHACRLPVARLGPASGASNSSRRGAMRALAWTSRSSEHGTGSAIVREARLLLGLYLLAAVGSIALSSAALLYLWVGPALLGQPFLRLYLLAEHTGCPLVASMLENSRTTRSLAPIRRLAWNMPYHAEHHACPALPFHALPSSAPPAAGSNRRPGAGLCRCPPRDSGGPAPGRVRARSGDARPERPAQLTHNGVAGSSSSRLGAIGSPQLTQ